MPGGFVEALETAVSLEGLLLLLAGTIAGAISGLIPGLSGLTGMALFLPLTLAMSPGGALLFFAGLSGAPRFTGAILSIVLNIPGSPVNAATAFDGYPMARRGEADRAIAIAATSSILGTLFGLLVLLALMPVILTTLRVVGPAELFALAVLALTTIAFASSTDVGAFLKGLVSGGIGLMIGFIGIATVTGVARFNFGSENYLVDGIRLVPLFIGIFAVAQVIRFAVDERGTVAESTTGAAGRAGVRRGITDTFRHWSTLLQGSAIGAGIGVLPGIGGVAANFLSYSWAKGRSRHPERYGKGAPEGVVATESSNNAEMVSSIVPTISFGIPGSAEGALILGLLTLHGYLTGPLLLQRHPETLWLLVVGALLSAVVISVWGLLGVRSLARVTVVPLTYLVPVILVASLFGTFAAQRNLWDVVMAVGIGIVGYFFLRYGYSPAALVIGYVLAHLAEDQFILGFQSGGRTYTTFFTRPVALAIWVLVVVIVILSVGAARRSRRDRGPAAAIRGAGESHGLPSIAFALLLAVFVGYLVIDALDLQVLARRVPLVIGIPTFVLLLGAMASEVLALRRTHKHRAAGVRVPADTSSVSPGAQIPADASKDRWSRIRRALVFGWLLAFVSLLYAFGFVIASVVATIAYAVYDLRIDPERRDLRWGQVATRALVLAAVVGLLLFGAEAIGMSTFEGVVFGDRPPRW